MKKIKVLPTPKPIETDGLVILVDILRATSTIVALLAHDAVCVKPVSTIEEAFLYKEKGYLLAGERNCTPPEGFHMGNSPLEAEKARRAKVVLTTSNGTKALSFVQNAKAICAGSFLNINAVLEFAKRFEEVVILCAGTEEELSLEDFLWAGMFLGKFDDYQTQNDAAEVALRYAKNTDNIFEEIKRSHHAQRLIKLGFEKDVAFCAKENLYGILPILTNEGFIALKGFEK
ncbi:2-phosphosulfolactate phosphatase [Thermodesulfatator atlanticus]|uniref:2-phosphosulfolactate phosphatase n=1 Tax=Thermodesulfatator atlanticus TaxID=501497 RepID=UPI0003B7636E|nr:2-phosphosulfolactate phosphatase [Thermodesulfatator atlanticus]